MLARPAPLVANRKRLRGSGMTAGRGLTNGESHDESQHHLAARCGQPLRPSDAPLEPQDEAVHLRQPRGHLHHRPQADARGPRPGVHVRVRAGQEGRHRAVRGHEEAGPGGRRRCCEPLRHALRERPLARRHADQLRDHPLPREPHGGAGGHGGRRPHGRAAQEGADPAAQGAVQAADEPQRHPQHEAHARRRVCDRHEPRGHRHP